jgi:hypothetical protein
MVRRDTSDELRTKVANLKQTRRSAAASMHRWLDILIADAESELREGMPPDDAPRPPGPPPSPPGRPATPATPNPRSTYPFDEQAPWQRAQLVARPEP